MRKFAVVVAGAAVSFAVPALAQDYAATAINKKDVGSFTVYGATQSSIVDAPAVPGGKALRVSVPGKGANPWDGGVLSPVTGPIKAGDELVYVFYARLESGENGATTAALPGNNVSLANPPYTPLFGGPATIDANWKLLRARWVANKDYASGTLMAGVNIATGKQVIDFGPMYVSKVGGAGAASAGSLAAELSTKIVNDPGAPAVTGAKAKLVDDSKVQGGKALRVSVAKKGKNSWDSAIDSPLKKRVKKGDKLVLIFDARLQDGSAGAGTASFNAALQMNAEPWTTIVSNQASVTAEWKSFRYEGKADKDYAPEGVKATIHVGQAKQVIDFGPIVVLNMGQ